MTSNGLEVSNAMLLRIFHRPIFLAVLSLAIIVIEALLLTDAPPRSVIGPILTLAHQAAEVASALVLLYASFDAGIRLWKLRRWEAGKGEFCHRCGGPVEITWNRRRPQTRCWFCGGRSSV